MKVSIFEVGPRDGLQNEPRPVSVADRAEFVARLAAAGLRDLEVGSFVHPERVPQMAGTEAVLTAIRARKLPRSARLWTLIPNLRGLERAKAAGSRRIALFTAATESFNQRNIGMSIDESLARYAEVVKAARQQIRGVEIRGYVSTVFGCPFEGQVAPRAALKVIERFARLGLDQISIGDTIGVATPKGVDAVLKPALRSLGRAKIAGHLHDTRGTALANSLRAIELGVRTLDASAGGLGGCPFAPGATGNLATEDLVYMLDGMGIDCGVDLEQLANTSLWLAAKMQRPLSSRYLQAHQAACERRARYAAQALKPPKKGMH